MPETAADYDARLRTHLDADGRLPLPEDGIPYWDIFPFEAAGLRLKAIEPALEREPDRFGEDPATCRCSDPDTADEDIVWENDRWRLSAEGPSGAPLVLVLVPKEHY